MEQRVSNEKLGEDTNIQCIILVHGYEKGNHGRGKQGLREAGE